MTDIDIFRTRSFSIFHADVELLAKTVLRNLLDPTLVYEENKRS